METAKSKGRHNIKGGVTILGKIFAYQQTTGQKWDDILRMPYIAFVLAMADAPAVDYEDQKNSSVKVKDHETAEDELNTMLSIFKR